MYMVPPVVGKGEYMKVTTAASSQLFISKENASHRAQEREKGGEENVTEKPNSIEYGTRRGESGVRCRSRASPSSSCVIVAKRWKNEEGREPH